MISQAKHAQIQVQTHSPKQEKDSHGERWYLHYISDAKANPVHLGGKTWVKPLRQINSKGVFQKWGAKAKYSLSMLMLLVLSFLPQTAQEASHALPLSASLLFQEGRTD